MLPLCCCLGGLHNRSEAKALERWDPHFLKIPEIQATGFQMGTEIWTRNIRLFGGLSWWNKTAIVASISTHLSLTAAEMTGCRSTEADELSIEPLILSQMIYCSSGEQCWPLVVEYICFLSVVTYNNLIEKSKSEGYAAQILFNQLMLQHH